MAQPQEEVVEVVYKHSYRISMKSAVWATAIVVLAMSALYGVFGLPPTLEGYYSKMYFHSIGIGIAALASYLVMSVFDLSKQEPPIDFPLHYRGLAATAFAAAGGLIYLNPSVDSLLPDLGLGFFVVAFILIGDVGGALFIQLMLYPRKLAGTYSEKANYIGKMFPRSRKDFDAYKAAGVAYWLAIASVGSAFIAGMIGFANLWVRIFGASIFTGYLSWVNLDAAGFLEATFDPHTHEIALAIMAGVIALAAQQFRVLDLGRVKKNVARVGLWVSVAGVVAMTVVFLAISFAGYSPPTLLQGGAQGENGIAGDDMTMSFIAFGAMVALVPLLLTRTTPDGRASWRDPLRLALVGTWIAAVVVNVGEAFYIEMNETLFSGSLAANDQVFSQVQALYGVFALTAAALLLLAVDHYSVSGRIRSRVGWLSLAGIVVSATGASLRTFVDPTRSWIPFGARVYTVLFLGACMLLAVEAIRTARVVGVSVPLAAGQVMAVQEEQSRTL